MKRIAAVLVFMCLLSTQFTGCKKKKIENQPATIDVVTSFGSNDSVGSQYDLLLNEFETEYNHITLNDKSANANDQWKALVRTQFETNQEPDVFFFYNGVDVKKMITNKQLVSIKTIREEYPDYCLNISDKAIGAMKEFDGNTYAVPITGFWEGLFCNKELFEKYNVPEITDIGSLFKAVEMFNKNGVTPIAASFSDIPNYWIEHAILANGAKGHSANPKTLEEVPNEWFSGLGRLKGLYKSDAFQRDALVTRHDLSVKLFNEEKAAMLLEGSWVTIDPKIANKVKVSRFPSISGVQKDNQAIIAGYSMGFYITQKAWEDPAKRDACVKYVEYMTMDKSIPRITYLGMPATKNPPTGSDSPILKQGDELYKQYQLALPIDNRLEKGAWEYLTSMIPGFLEDKVTLDEIMKVVVQKNAGK